MDNKQTEAFFEVQKPSSYIKAKIVSEYFPRYCRIIDRDESQTKIRFIDLFCGPGIYKDGNYSTPMMVLNYCSSNPKMRKKVELMFNDIKFGTVMEENFVKYFNPSDFTFRPRFGNLSVGDDVKLNQFLTKDTRDENGTNTAPSVLFIDPFGYKAIDTTVLAKFMKNWGNEIFLFLNTKRINPGISNPKFEENMQRIFPTSLENIRVEKLQLISVAERLNLILENLKKEYNSVLGHDVFCTPFRFQEEDSEGTSHFILHFTKHKKGFELIKQIYHDFDNSGTVLDKYGTYTFDAKLIDRQNRGLNFGDANVIELSKIILQDFGGRELTAKKLFDEHQNKHNYSKTHYTLALRLLVQNGAVSAIFTDNKTHKVSLLVNEHSLLKFN